MTYGGIAQLVRAPALQAGGPWFESMYPHKIATYLSGFFYFKGMKEFFVYIIQSEFGHIYIGQTKNLEDRIKRHNSNRSKSANNKGKWERYYLSWQEL